MNKHTKEYFEISLLLYKKQTSLLRKEEEMVLNEWKERSLENRKLYDRMSADLNIEEKKNQYDGIDASAAWEKLDDKLNEKKPIERRLFTQFIKYAAVLILPLAIGAFLVFQVMDSTEYSSDLVEQINPGSTKATLVLSDGQVVDLEKEVDTLIEGSALNKDQKLIYQEKQEQLAQAKPRWHKLVVPIGGEYELKLADGTKVILNSNSELKYTDRFVGKQRLVYLKGEGYFDVAKDKEHPFIVRTSSMDVRVFGTQFNVMDYEEESISQTTLVEGSVAVSVKNETGILKSIKIKPNMQVEYQRGDVDLKVKNVNASLYVGWVHGKFQFNNEDLGSIMRKLSRWYDVKFFTQNREIQDIKFTGDFKRFDDFETVLDLLEIGSGVEFEVNGKNVIARSKNK